MNCRKMQGVVTLSGLMACSVGVLMQSVAAYAAPILTHNTGRDATNTVNLGNGATELHYTLVGPSPTVGAPFVVNAALGFPIPPWIANNLTSAWIVPSKNTLGVFNGVYHYETTFNLTGFNITTAVLNGMWAEDDFGGNILINGTDLITGGFGTYLNGSGFTNWDPFMVTGGFVPGINTLTFVVTNLGGGPTGLRVEYEGTADRSVPEPGSMALLALGLAGLASLRRR